MQLSFRAESTLVEETDQAARLSGLTRSDYLRHAIEAENRRVLEERMQNLSNSLSGSHLSENQHYDVSIGDGL